MTAHPRPGADPDRRSVLRYGLAASSAAAAGPYLLTGCGDDEQTVESAEEFENAGIDWRQVEGESINVAVIPATYFTNLIELLDEFEELTGIEANVEEIPPEQIRDNVVLDMSSESGEYHTHAADPMYYPLYVANGWVEPLDAYLEDPDLTNPEWFDYTDVIQKWREATMIDGETFGIPYDGEVTIQVYRSDLYDDAGLSPAEDFEQFRANAEAVHDPDERVWGTALRGIPGAGQNMYIYPSLFRAWGGEWFDGDEPSVNSPEAVEALEYYVDLLNDLAPSGVTNWNWPDIADAFAAGTLGSYIDAHSSAAVLTDPQTSTVIDNLAFARQPQGPSGRRVTSIWNWSFPINRVVSDRAKRATWLFIQWATSHETQARTSYQWTDENHRSGVNRTSIWQSEDYAAKVSAGENFTNAAFASLEDDTDIDWRPRVPQWPRIGERMAVLVQSALVGEMSPKQALDAANDEIVEILS